MAPPLTLSFSSGIGDVAAQDGEHLRGEGLVHLDEVGVFGQELAALGGASMAKTGPRPMRAGSQPA